MINGTVRAAQNGCRSVGHDVQMARQVKTTIVASKFDGWLRAGSYGGGGGRSIPSFVDATKCQKGVRAGGETAERRATDDKKWSVGGRSAFHPLTEMRVSPSPSAAVPTSGAHIARPRTHCARCGRLRDTRTSPAALLRCRYLPPPRTRQCRARALRLHAPSAVAAWVGEGEEEAPMRS